jgi:hypothetical protein
LKGKPDEFLSWLCHLLDLRLIYKNEYIFERDKNIEFISFLFKGKAGIVIPFKVKKNIVFVELEEGDEMGTIDV